MTHQHIYRLIVSRRKDGIYGLEFWTTKPEQYMFYCRDCGDKQDATWETASQRGLVEVFDLATRRGSWETEQ